MLEFLFCPQHGLLRPDNVMFLMAYSQNVIVTAQLWVIRARGWLTLWT